MMATLKIHKNLKEAIYGFVGQLFSVGKLFSLSILEESSKNIENTKVKSLLEEFQSIFAELRSLPPIGKLDHKSFLFQRPN
jgi:hypothetical protein